MFRIIKYFLWLLVIILVSVFAINCDNNVTEPKTTNVETELGPPNLPNTISIGVYPNPFTHATNIRFDLPENGHASLIIYNTFKQPVLVIRDSNSEAGYYSVVWDSKDDNGNEVPDGIYICELKCNDSQKSITMLKISEY